MTNMPILLEVRGISKRFGGVLAVNAIDLTVREGEIVALIGPNGAGKTTLFNIVTGFLKQTQGEVFFRNQNVTAMAPHRRGKLGIVCTFQKTAIFAGVTVLQAIRMGQHRKMRATIFDAIIGSNLHWREEQEATDRAHEILNFVGLEDCADQLAGSLSYGQQRLVELGIALAAGPELLLLDEPAAGLNPTESAELINVLLAVRSRGTSILLVEHDMSVTMGICDRIVVIASGTKIAEGLPIEIQENEAVIEAYLGAPVDVET
jgi:branched-chain amino acid transport system ATP-binding protein